MNNTWTRINTSNDFKNTVVFKAIFFLFLTIISLPVAATVSDCKDTNPLDVDSVFRCMASYRVKPDGRNLFERNIEKTSCRTLSKKYKRALGVSGVRYDRNDDASIRAVLPSCEIFSEIARRFTGNTPSWSSCLGRPESKKHLKNCLESTAKRYYGKPLGSFGGCTGLSKLYKRGITDASNFIGSKIEQNYLAALEQISCVDYLAVLQEQEPIIAARWSSCMNYNPESKEAHLRACIGDDIRKLNSCQKVRALYEKKIKEAAGGTFPPGYILLDCALAESLIAEEKERVEKKRLATIELNEKKRATQEQYRAAQRARAQKTVIAPSPTLASGREVSETTGGTSGSIASQWITLITFLAVLIFLWRKGIIGKLLNSFSTSDLWKMSWEKISDQDDFPNTVVYRKDGAKFKIYRVSFDNKELFVKGWRPILKSLFFLAGLFAAFPVASFLIKIGWNGSFTFFLMIGVIVIWFLKIKLPWTVNRIIELDRNTDTLRVLNEGRLEIERKLSRMDTLTVEPHPEAEFVRLSRQEKMEKRISNEEKSHCLFGMFGIDGAERVVLITRAEWPNYNSLSEVRLAVLWAKKLALGLDRVVDSAPDISETADRGMKPPLD